MLRESRDNTMAAASGDRVQAEVIALSGDPASGGVAAGRIVTLAVNHARRYYWAMIRSFKCPDTESLAKGIRVKRFVNIEAVARRKLRQLEIAARLDDLKIPPGNRLEALKGRRAGQYSIRINDQWRVCFRWTQAGALDVEIIDYH